MPETPASRPRLRGVSHLSMFPVAAGLRDPARVHRAQRRGARLGDRVRRRRHGDVRGERLLPRDHVDAAVRRWLARLDHATVYGLIAATYTPFGLLVLDGAWQVTILAIVWSGAAVGDPHEAVLGRRAEVAVGVDRARARLGERRRDARDRAAIGVGGFCSSPRADCSTPPARSCMRCAVRIRRRVSSDTTSCSTRS